MDLYVAYTILDIYKEIEDTHSVFYKCLTTRISNLRAIYSTFLDTLGGYKIFKDTLKISWEVYTGEVKTDEDIENAIDEIIRTYPCVNRDSDNEYMNFLIYLRKRRWMPEVNGFEDVYRDFCADVYKDMTDENKLVHLSAISGIHIFIDYINVALPTCIKNLVYRIKHGKSIYNYISYMNKHVRYDPLDYRSYDINLISETETYIKLSSSKDK